MIGHYSHLRHQLFSNKISFRSLQKFSNFNFFFISNFNSSFFRQMLDCSCIFNSLFIYQTFKIQFLNYIHLINSAVYIWFHMFVCNFIFLEKIWLIKMRTIPLYNNSKNNIGNPITDFLRWFLSYYSRFSFWKTLF